MKKVPVTKRAIIQRINRRLEEEGHRLRTSRGRQAQNLGDYYILDESLNAVVDTHIDLEEYGREIGALAKHEELEQE